MITACKPVEIERRCQEQRHHCLHSLPLVLQTETHARANPAVGWDGVSRLRFSATSNRGAGTGPLPTCLTCTAIESEPSLLIAQSMLLQR